LRSSTEPVVVETVVQAPVPAPSTKTEDQLRLELATTQLELEKMKSSRLAEELERTKQDLARARSYRDEAHAYRDLKRRYDELEYEARGMRDRLSYSHPNWNHDPTWYPQAPSPKRQYFGEYGKVEDVRRKTSDEFEGRSEGRG
jgi:hypothetical protein